MNDSFDQPDAANREELVAYLDGELSPEEARAVEERLARDDALRREMQGFDRAWSALDELPHATVDDSFTKTTIEMVTVAAQQDVAELTQALPAIRRRRAWWIAGITAVAATLGFALARVVLDYPNRVLLANLPVVQHYDAYSQNISPEFLQRLQVDGAELLKPYEDEALEQRLEELRATTKASVGERREIVSQMTDADKAALSANLKRFQILPRASQEQLVALHGEIQSSPGAEELQRAMLANWAWTVDQLPDAADQAELRGKSDVKDRIERMSQIERHSEWRIRFSPQELASIREVLHEFENDPQLVALSDHLSKHVPRRKDWERWRTKRPIPFPRVVLLSIVSRERPEDPEISLLQNQLRDQLSAALSEETRQKIESRAARDPGQRNWILHSAIVQAAFSAFNPSETELEQFLDSGAIDNNDLRRLMAMPRQEMLSELTKIYIEKQLGVDLPDVWRRREYFRFGPDFRERKPPPPDGRGGEPWGPDDRDRGPGPRRNGGPHGGPPGGPPPGERPPRPRPDDGHGPLPPPPPSEEAAI